MELLPLCALAFLAGFVDSIVGGGGLIQLPALFIFLPPGLAASTASVLGTNKFSAFCGTGFAALRYARAVQINWASILPTGVAAFAFSALGARVVSHLAAELVRPLLFILLLVVAVYTVWRKDFGSLHAPRLTARAEQMAGIVIGMALGFYDGFFGPGTGSFLMFLFIGLFGFDFLNASASTKVVNAATNLAALLYFAWAGHIFVEYAVPMGLCNVLGALLGTRLAILKGNRLVRGFFLVVVGVMLLRFGWEMWAGR